MRHRRHPWFTQVFVSAVLGLSWGCSKSEPLVLNLSPVDMNPTGNFMVNQAGEVVFLGEGKMEADVYMERGHTTVRIRAIGDPAHTAVLQVQVDGREMGKLSVDSREPRDYSIVATVNRSGIQPLRISVSNAWTTVQQVTLSPVSTPEQQPLPTSPGAPAAVAR